MDLPRSNTDAAPDTSVPVRLLRLLKLLLTVILLAITVWQALSGALPLSALPWVTSLPLAARG